MGDFDWAVREFGRSRGRPFEGFPKGASGYFHERVIAANRSHAARPSAWVAQDEYFLELLYALLTAWGMDSQKARLEEFPKFTAAVRKLVAHPAFIDLESERLSSVGEAWARRLSPLWELLGSSCRIMASESILVGSSKLLHHLVPDLFPPIDRSYTLAFFSSLAKDDPYRLSVSACQRPGFDAFWTVMRFFGYAAREIPNIENYVGKGPMSGSVPKVLDNALIAWWGTD